MAVDVFVMPLWRFKIGDFETGVEKLAGGTDRVYYTDGTGIFRRLRPTGWLARVRAKRAVRRIQRAVAAANGRAVAWIDDGEIVYSQQLHDYEPLLSYVWWLDRVDLIPALPDLRDESTKREFYQVARDRPPGFPHIHACPFYTGYILPCDFGRPVEVEPHLIFDTWPGGWRTVSASRLASELDRVNQQLRTPADYHWREDDPLASVRITFCRIREIVDLSLRHGLPAIFWG